MRQGVQTKSGTQNTECKLQAGGKLSGSLSIPVKSQNKDKLTSVQYNLYLYVHLHLYLYLYSYCIFLHVCSSQMRYNLYSYIRVSCVLPDDFCVMDFCPDANKTQYILICIHVYFYLYFYCICVLIFKCVFYL